MRWAAIPLGLIVVQFFLAYAAYSAAIIGVLHGLNALAIFAVALLAGRRVPKPAPVAEPSAPGGCASLNVRVSAGGSLIDPQVVEALVRGRARVRASALKDLTPRELDVLGEMAQGRGNAGIAAHLHLSESSVEKHVNAIFTKLGLTTEDLSHRRVTAVLTFLRDAGLRG